VVTQGGQVPWAVALSSIPSISVVLSTVGANASTVTVTNVPGQSLSVTLSNQVPLAVTISTMPTTTITGQGGPTLPVFVSSLPLTTVTGSGGNVLPVWISSGIVSISTQGATTSTVAVVNATGQSLSVTFGNQVPLAVALSSAPLTTIVGQGGATLPVFISSLPVLGNVSPLAVSMSSVPVHQVTLSTGGVNGSTVTVVIFPSISTNTVNVENSAEVSLVYVGTTPYTVNVATVNASSSGYNLVVSTSAGKRIMAIGWDLTVNGAVNFKWVSSSGPTTDLTGLYYGAAAGNGVARECPRYCFQSKYGEGLGINLSGATAVGGTLQYILSQ
jgi:hypothetical protein